MDKFSALGMFVATAEQGSFSRAAELLGKTPSALTKAVGHLERELGAQLFERSTRRIVLTEAGRLYLDTARQVLQRLHEAGEEIGQLQSVVGGDRALLEDGIKYIRAVSFDQYLQDAPAVLDDAQRLCLLVNACDSLLSDGTAAPQEQAMFGKLLAAMGFSEERFTPYFQTIAVKNNRPVFGR